MGSASARGGAQFGALLNVKFSNSSYPPRKAVAAELDIGVSTLGEYIRRGLNFPPDLIVLLVEATGDLDYIRFFTRPLGLGIHRVPEGQSVEDPAELLETLASAMEAFGGLARAVAQSTRVDSDGGRRVTQSEARGITDAYYRTLEIMAAVVATAQAQAGKHGEDPL